MLNHSVQLIVQHQEEEAFDLLWQMLHTLRHEAVAIEEDPHDAADANLASVTATDADAEMDHDTAQSGEDQLVQANGTEGAPHLYPLSSAPDITILATPCSVCQNTDHINTHHDPSFHHHPYNHLHHHRQHKQQHQQQQQDDEQSNILSDTAMPIYAVAFDVKYLVECTHNTSNRNFSASPGGSAKITGAHGAVSTDILTSVVIYNMGLIVHLQAMRTGRGELLYKALHLYQTAMQSLNTHHLDPFSQTMARPSISLAMLALALFNNMCNIHTKLFDKSNVIWCLQSMRTILIDAHSSVHRDARVGSEDPFLFFYQTLLANYDTSNVMRVAPCA
jgi:hypothetical protein